MGNISGVEHENGLRFYPMMDRWKFVHMFGAGSIRGLNWKPGLSEALKSGSIPTFVRVIQRPLEKWRFTGVPSSNPNKQIINFTACVVASQEW